MVDDKDGRRAGRALGGMGGGQCGGINSYILYLLLFRSVWFARPRVIRLLALGSPCGPPDLIAEPFSTSERRQ
jgi:hypothetical protein